MLLSSSTWLAVVLLASAAMLASYLLSQWSILRSGGRHLGWAALSIAVLVLLVAAGLMTLSLRSMATLHLPWADTLASYFIKPAPPDFHPLPQTGDSPSVTRDSTTDDNQQGEHASDGPNLRTSSSEISDAVASQPLGESMVKVSDARPTRIVPPAANSWAATACVALLNEVTGRRRVVNGCAGPVVVVFTSCPEADCSPMVLPSNAQRTVFQDDETRYGENIRYVACEVTLPAAIQLIGRPVEERETDAWAAAFQAAHMQDQCLSHAP